MIQTVIDHCYPVEGPRWSFTRNLYALGLRLGRDIFDDAEGFRGAVDDFLDEDAATTGDINLLVDAVRLGALRT